MDQVENAKESSELTIRVPFDRQERAAFDSLMDRHHYKKGGWVKAAILAQMAREDAEVEARR